MNNLIENLSTVKLTRIIAENWLILNGFSYQSVRDENMRGSYDFLVNETVRLQVFGSKYDTNNKRYSYAFTQSLKKGSKPSEFHIPLSNGRIRKLYRKTCDVMLFVGIRDEMIDFWCVPSDQIDDHLQLMTLKPENEPFPLLEFYDNPAIIEQYKKTHSFCE